MAIIAISRSTLKGGKALAELVGEKTGYPIFSRETVLEQAAEEYGISVEDLEQTIQQPPPIWQQVPGKRISFIKCFTSVLLDMAGGKDFIYHGQAGHLLLDGVAHVLRVRVIADMGYRINAVMEQLGIDRNEAIAHIQKVDKERNDWMQFFYGLDWGEPTLYDIIINLEKVRLASACGAIMYLNEQPDFRSTTESEKAMGDLTLSTRVWAALAKNTTTQSASVNVKADGGNVTISGSVGSMKIVNAIPSIALQVKGVEEITNNVGIGGNWYW